MIEIPGPPFAPRLTFSLISARDERARHVRHLEQAVLGLGRDLRGQSSPRRWSTGSSDTLRGRRVVEMGVLVKANHGVAQRDRAIDHRAVRGRHQVCSCHAPMALESREHHRRRRYVGDLYSRREHSLPARPLRQESSPRFAAVCALCMTLIVRSMVRIHPELSHGLQAFHSPIGSSRRRAPAPARTPAAPPGDSRAGHLRSSAHTTTACRPGSSRPEAGPTGSRLRHGGRASGSRAAGARRVVTVDRGLCSAAFSVRLARACARRHSGRRRRSAR